MPVKLFFLSDTHLGFDDPVRPRIERRRRGADFFANYHRVLQKAAEEEADAVIHGGDLFFRRRVHPSIVDRALQPLIGLADGGIPVLLVPGNHERSTLPLDLLHRHSNIHCFFHPRTITLSFNGIDVAFAGFPFVRHRIREFFPQILQETGWKRPAADFRFLCMHHAVEGATVGVHNFVFQRRMDTIRCRDLPGNLDAVLSGHIHRHQVLTCDLTGKPLSSPVIYPGSVERTSVAERLEEKGFVVLELEINSKNQKGLHRRFCPLPSRPMFLFEFDGKQGNLKREIEQHLHGLPFDAVIHIRIKEFLPSRTEINTALLRSMVPPSVNITLTVT